MKQFIEVTIHQIWISPGHDFRGHHGGLRGENDVLSLEEAECHRGFGIVGDRYYDREKPGEKRQITFIDKGVVNEIALKLNKANLDASQFRRNVLIEGADLNELIGKRFSLHGVIFEGVEECSPCSWMEEAIGRGALDLMVERGGLRCRILNDGTIKRGKCVIELLSPEE